jgi:hypothetical protein
MRHSFNFVSILCYDGNSDGSTGEDQGTSTGNSVADGGGGDAGDAGKTGGNPPTFTQDEVNKFLADDKRKHQERFTQLEGSYKDLLQNQNLTTEERDSLQTRLADAQKENRSTEQQAEFERKQTEEKSLAELSVSEARGDKWESLFKTSEVKRSLQDAATSADAWNPSQIVTHLQPYAVLKEDGGVFTTMVDFPDIDEKTGESINTLRTPMDAVKRMQQLPKLHGNLFKSNVVSGVGAGQGASPGTGDIDYANMTATEYRKQRADIKERLG